MKNSKNYIILLAIACVLLAVLFAVKGYNTNFKMVEAKVVSTNFSFDKYEKEIHGSLSESEKNTIDNFKNKQLNDKSFSDSLFQYWVDLKHPEIGANYILRQKDTVSNDSIWLRAGEGFYTGGLSQSDSNAYTYF